ncbi:MAG TPA: Rrf2 family transcriptional regulator [Bryobacteraceae bacterium]
MQLTRAADYAVRVMVHLAALPPGTRTSRTELAEAAGCPEQFLSKVLQNLTRAGLVASHRGNTGGFELLDTQRRASVLDVVEAIEGPTHLNLCLGADGGCTRQAACPTYDVWVQAQHAMTEVLRTTAIDELARRTPIAPQL